MPLVPGRNILSRVQHKQLTINVQHLKQGLLNSLSWPGGRELCAAGGARAARTGGRCLGRLWQLRTPYRLGPAGARPMRRLSLDCAGSGEGLSVSVIDCSFAGVGHLQVRVLQQGTACSLTFHNAAGCIARCQRLVPALIRSPVHWLQVKGATRPADVAAALMELEAALRRSVLAHDWDAPPAGAASACSFLVLMACSWLAGNSKEHLRQKNAA